MNRAIAYTTIQRELTDFLEMWRTKGYAAASGTYLVPDQQLAASETAVVLVSGRLTAFRENEWTLPTRVRVEVDFDLTFSGYSGAWGTGTNTRFVTATTRSGPIPYVLELATSR